jgi:hypothetical protein
MIDFKNIDKIPRRITKHSVNEGDFYTLSISALEKEKLYDENKKKPEEEMIVIVLGKVLCDESGKLQNLSLEEFKKLPDALFKDIVNACLGQVTGEKKS